MVIPVGRNLFTQYPKYPTNFEETDKIDRRTNLTAATWC